MKAKDLMIGDLVYYIHTEDGIAPYKEVICIQAEDLCRDACIIETHYEPIPLTPEILEKNFEKKTFFGLYDDYFDLDIREYSDGIYIVTYHSCEMNIPDQTVHVSWVHELQHFMRHCGITLNIEV